MDQPHVRDPSPGQLPLAAAAALLLAALVARVALVYGTPEGWADGYHHALLSWEIAGAIRGGALEEAAAKCCSAWLPFLHIAAASVLLLRDDPLHVPRLLSALFGAATVALVYLMAHERLTARAWLAAGLLLLAPYHLFLSAYAMTEAATGFFLTLALAAFLRAEPTNRWFMAVPIALAPATLLRYEVWPFALLVWILGRLQRRASAAVWVGSAALFALPAAGWLALNGAVKGDPLFFGRVTARYLRESFHAENPGAATRDLASVAAYGASLLAVAGAAALLAVVGAVRGDAHRRDRMAVASFAGGYVAILVALYASASSAGWPRYWVPALPAISILAAMGVDALARAGGQGASGLARLSRGAVPALAVAAAAASLLPGLAEIRLQSQGAAHHLELGLALRDRPPDGRIYADEAAVILRSGLPRARFVTWNDLGEQTIPEARLALERSGVRALVWSGADYAPTRRMYPELANPAQPPAGFALVFDPPSNRMTEYVVPPAYLYRLPHAR